MIEDEQEFINYYNILQVDPSCDAKILESAYRYFAKMYHPDHPETADVDKFSEITQAYRVLRDPEKRAEYDRAHFPKKPKTGNSFPKQWDLDIDAKTAIDDAEIREKILLHLYKRRRENAYDAGIGGWLLQEQLNCSENNFEFHVWYLKSKGLVQVTEQGTLAVTVQGVDHVFSMCRTNLAEQLLIEQSESLHASASPTGAPQTGSE